MKATFLSRFTPSMMLPEALETLFVQRQALAQRIVELIRDSVLTQAKHHHLLIGPRGIGKTHLISLVYHRVRAMDDLRERLFIAWLREEEWGVTSFLDCLLRIFRALRTEYGELVPVERVESLYNLSRRAAERAGADLLKEFVGNRTLFVLVENLDDLFEGLGDEGQKRLRAYLQENPFCTILATAQSLFNGISLQTSPFYGFFRLHHLEELDFEDATQLLTKIADFEGNLELVSLIQTPLGRARIRAVHHLAGGNHRVYVIFSQFLTRESLDELVDPLMRTLDDLTPYYQARMAWLSPQQRKVVEFLCDCRRAVSVKEIAQRCFMTHQTTSGQLKTLREMGYVHAESVGRESYYELREPLMRLCMEVKKNRGEPIRLCVDFLRLWYTQTELRQRLELLQPNSTFEREYVLCALRETEEGTEDPRIKACWKDCRAYSQAKDYSRALQVAEELVALRDAAWSWCVQGTCFHQLGRHSEALASFDKAIELDPQHVEGWLGRAMVLGDLERWDKALVSFDKVIELDPKHVSAWDLRGLILAIFKRYEESLASFDKVIQLDPSDADAWSLQSIVLHRLGRWEETLTSCDRAIALGVQSPDIFFTRAEVLVVLNRWDDGIAALDDALHRIVHADVFFDTYTGTIVHTLLRDVQNIVAWPTRVATLIELYEKYQVPSALAQGLVRNIPLLTSPTINDATACSWLELWQELAGDYREFELPLRLLDAAVRYRETHDPRILLELPVEERKLLEPLLAMKGAIAKKPENSRQAV